MSIFVQVLLVGLISFGFFTISFILLGYPIQWSVFLGVLGGWASGFIVKAWNTTDNPKSSPDAIGKNDKHKNTTINNSNTLQSNREQNQTKLSIWQWLFNRPRRTRNFNSEKDPKS